MDNSEKLKMWNDELVPLLIPNNVFLGLYILIGIFGNSLVLFVYIFRMKSGKDDRYFIPSLAAMDLFACVIGSSYALSLNLLPVAFSGDFVCKFLWFMSQFTTVSSSLLLLVIAVHRYMKVCKPLKPKWSLHRKRLAVVLTVTTSFIASLPTFAFYGEIEIFNQNLNITGYRCSHVHEEMLSYDLLIVYNCVLFIFASLGIVLISILYTLIGKSIYRKVILYRKSFRRPKRIPRPKLSVSADENFSAFANDVMKNNTDEGTPNNSETEHQNTPSREDDRVSEISRSRSTCNSTVSILTSPRKSHIPRTLGGKPIPNMKNHFLHYKYSYMFMTIAIVFVVSYLPRIVIMLLESIYDDFWRKSDAAIAALLFLYRMYILNHVTNPFIYGFFDGTFRHEVRLIFCRCRKPLDDKQPEKSNTT